MDDRLGWTRAPRASLEQWAALAEFAAATRDAGFTHTLVCGMGGSSLAAAVLADSFRAPELRVLDSTDPAAVRAAERAGPLERTLFLIASKSGTTVETLAAYRYFATRARPDQFVAVTDPGTPLEQLAGEARFRSVFPHPADVGGRYAALTVVGLLPAALIGADGRTLLQRAAALDLAPARALGDRLADAALGGGRDKLMLLPPPPVAGLAPWIEQLVAESTGKRGRGIVPVVGRPIGNGEQHPDVETVSDFSADPLDLGVEFLRWEYATWALCERLGVNAFDQPDVEEAKALARAELERPRGTASPPIATLSPIELRRVARPGDYVAILAYLPPLPEVAARLEAVRNAWGRATGCVTTLGFGPRYLHSTGQLHKGGPNTGLFLVITATDEEDLEIPGMGGGAGGGGGRTFGELKRAQALGDVRALLARHRRVCHVHLASIAELDQLERAGT